MSCRYDFDSLTHRYRGTAWSQASADTPAARVRPQPTFLWHVRRIILFYLGVAAVAGVGLWGIRNGILPSAQASMWVGALIFGLSSWIAAFASKIIPGRNARGFWKSTYIVGFLGWLGGFSLLAVTGWRYGSLFDSGSSIEVLFDPASSIELALAALAVASIIRLALLVTE